MVFKDYSADILFNPLKSVYEAEKPAELLAFSAYSGMKSRKSNTISLIFCLEASGRT
ncbi:MAG: hypothetical protein II795_05100 [Firmicutes bacterium]|nr:hypothetical protein [Bacillota bacterium]